ncbi:MAG: archaetidylserine decarboxylase [bacterium]
MKPRLIDRINTGLLKILPQHFLSSLMYRVARSEWPPLKNFLIHFVVAKFKVDLFEAKNPETESYASFNAFFTRELRADARTICTGSREIACPVDGTVSQAGNIIDGRLMQAKGHDFSLNALLGDNLELASHFSGGQFATIYLSPRDYHRIHMPLDGKLREMLFVPGKLFSVSDATTQLVPELFAINERTICLFDTAAGPMAVILVGAIFVGSMETVWEGEVGADSTDITLWDYTHHEPIILSKGDELGRFNMGSTVIILMPKGASQWDESVVPGAQARVGESIGLISNDPVEN